ncbi:MAG TPA: GNAT family N-acetyltransferase [Acidimicrobiales bacterium]|nr:GNAT family N-acetyltransferase [Acidimicrobiales bacterium]
MEGARLATRDDVARLADLVVEAIAEQATGRGGPVWSQREARGVPAAASLEEAVADPDRFVVVGTINDVVVGFAAAHVEELRNAELLGVVTDIYTEADARGVGVGEAMINEVLDWCRGRGCSGVDALALPGNRSTKNFFETFGFTARAIIVHRSLTGEAGA